MESMSMAFKAILSNKMRSFLTMLGIVIGVVSIVVLTAIGQGTNAAVVSNIEGMGTNLLSVSVNVRRNNPVTLKGLRQMTMGSESIAHVAPVLTSSGTVKAGLTQYEDGSLIATTPGYDKIRSWSLRYGRFLTEPDHDNRSFVAVLGQEAAVELFGSVNAVGCTFTYQGYTFTVVGVLDEIGNSVSGPGHRHDHGVLAVGRAAGHRVFGVYRRGVRSVSGSQSLRAETH